MANVLCQIQGSKRLILYPPSDVTFLDIQPGASSSSLNVFSPDAVIQHPRLQQAHPYETVLSPGDILYIPPLWFHTASPTDNLSVSVNVFFRNFNKPGTYAAGRDVYGNRDLQAYENGRKDVERIVRSFAGLPADVGRFYLERLAGELAERARA